MNTSKHSQYQNLQYALHAIADAIQMPLKIQDGNVSGGGDFHYTPFTGAGGILMGINPVALFSADQSGVLFHVRGDLNVLISHFAKTGSTSLFVLDQAKSAVPVKDLIQPKDGLRNVIEAIRVCIVGSFHHKDRKWHPLSLPT